MILDLRLGVADLLLQPLGVGRHGREPDMAAGVRPDLQKTPPDRRPKPGPVRHLDGPPAPREADAVARGESGRAPTASDGTKTVTGTLKRSRIGRAFSRTLAKPSSKLRGAARARRARAAVGNGDDMLGRDKVKALGQQPLDQPLQRQALVVEAMVREKAAQRGLRPLVLTQGQDRQGDGAKPACSRPSARSAALRRPATS